MSVVTAPAKLTLSLRITGVRADGYHLLDAEMASIDLVDTLTFADGDSLVVDGAPMVPTDERNLVRRALAAVGRTAAVSLDKRIPTGGGLGGGSADAAAVLRWAGRADVDDADDRALAAGLGADVVFCLRGGRARVTGIGDELEPLPFADRTLTLQLAPFGCSTPAVYRMWDELGGPTADGPNDLEPAALRVEPRMARWRDRLGDATGQTPMLAGSGATWFVDGAFPSDDPADRRVVVNTLPSY